jgi:predicted RNA-binding Zn-ribbon protein involved in translation (DUF1610 family)
MHFFKKITTHFSTLYHRLTCVSPKEKLNRLSLFIIILLDVFLLMALFKGLSDHSSQLTPPYKYFPLEYRNVLLTQTWDIPSQQMDSLQATVLNNKYRYNIKDKRHYKMHPVCEKLDAYLEKIKSDDALSQLFELRSKSKRHQLNLKEEILELNDIYRNHLIEKIVGQTSSPKIQNILKKIKIKTRQINKLEFEIQGIEKDVFLNPNVVSFLSVIKDISPEQKKALTHKIRQLNFWYPVKLLFYQLIFLFPLLWVTYIWSVRSQKKALYIQTLIATHLMVIISIPIIIRIIDIITEVIPNKLLKNFLRLLEALHIIALWHYFLIFLLVIIGGGLIRTIQKKAKERRSLVSIKWLDSHCHACSQKLPTISSSYCPYCGETHMVKCTTCHQLKFSVAPFCHECGA